MIYAFRWIDWNLGKIAKHGLIAEEVEFVINRAKRPYPQRIDDDKWIVKGLTPGKSYIQAIYVIDDDGETIFVIHARPLTPKEKSRQRKLK